MLVSTAGLGVELFDHFLLLGAVACAVALVKVLRGDGIGRGYAMLVGIQLVGAVLAMGADRFYGVLALGAIAATVVAPWLLEHSSRWAFGRGALVWTARLSSLRVSLMPGSGLAQQLPILDGLAVLERDGVDAALAHYRRLADETEDTTDLAMIHEQIVSMLFYGQRWDEGIAHYERRFDSGYAALRPNLALGLLRAYGESGRLETAAGLLRALEEGPVGADPSTAELLGQARLTFLAYAGAAGPVVELADDRGFAAGLGLSEATAALFKGIAQARAGDPTSATETLRRVETLAGPRDRRVLEAARGLLAGRTLLGERDSDPSSLDLGPELRIYVELVARRLRAFLTANPDVRLHSRTWATHALMVALALGYGMHLILGGGGVGLLELGALSESLWHSAGNRAWARAFTSVWLHVDLIGLLFDVYAIWLAGQIVERLLGPARMILVTVGAAVAGMAASVLALPVLWDLGWGALAVVASAGGGAMAVGAITAGLWLLLPSKTPGVAPRSRRNSLVTLSLLLVANVVIARPGVLGAGVAPVGLLVTAALATVLALALPVDLPKWAERSLGVVAGGVLLAAVAATGFVLAEDPERELVEHRTQVCVQAGAVLRTPVDFRAASLDRDVEHGLPIVPGVVDDLELRDGSLVQLAVHHGPVVEGEPAMFGVIDGLRTELSVTAAASVPEPFASMFTDDGDGQWQAFDLWRNGERVGRVIERRLPATPDDAEGERTTAMVIASPAESLAHAPELYAAILVDAERVGPGGDVGGRPRCAVE